MTMKSLARIAGRRGSSVANWKAGRSRRAVGIVEQGAVARIVDDPIVGIVALRSDTKAPSAASASRERGGKSRSVERDLSSSAVKSRMVSALPAPGAMVNGRCRRPGQSEQRVGAAAAVEHVGAGIAVDRVGEFVAGEVDRARRRMSASTASRPRLPPPAYSWTRAKTRSWPSPAPSTTTSPALST